MILSGSCIMYTAIRKVTWDDEDYELAANDGDYYITEPIEETTARLYNGLETLGFRGLNVSIKWFDKYREGNSCVKFECECDDNMHVKSEMYIRGIKTYEWQDEHDALLEIYFPNILI